MRIILYNLSILALLCGCSSNSPKCNDIVDNYTPREFYGLPKFTGKIVRYENLGMPDNPHDYSGPLLNIYIKSGDHNLAVLNFPSSLTATDTLEQMIGRKNDNLPHSIYVLRDSIFFD